RECCAAAAGPAPRPRRRRARGRMRWSSWGRDDGAVALAAGGGERGDANRPLQRNRATDHGALRSGLTAVRSVAQREAGELDGGAHRPALRRETGRGNAIADSRHLTIEPRQLALA